MLHPLRLLTIALLLLTPLSALALITGGYGDNPVPDRNWRTGSVDLANSSSRVGFWEGPPFGGGQYTFLYRGDTDHFVQALLLFAKIRAPELQLHVYDGPHADFWLEPRPDTSGKVDAPGRDARIDWTFTIWDADSFYRLNSNPNSIFGSASPDFRQPLPAPRLDVYIGGGQIDWTKVTVPAGIHVTDHRAVALGIKPEDGAVVMGTVYNLNTSKVLPNATISVTPRTQGKPAGEPTTGTTDAAGHFYLAHLSAGPIEITASAPGHASCIVAYDNLAAHDARSFDVNLAPEASIAGQVLAPDGKPLAGAQIVVYEPMGVDGRGYRLASEGHIISDANGNFEVKGLPSGFCQLSFFATGYSAKWDRTVHTIPSKDVVLYALATGTVRGKVLTPAGKPAPGANVNIQDAAGAKIGTWGGSVTVQPDGAFEFKQVPVGRYVISTKPFLPGEPADPSAQTVEVKAGEVLEVNLVAKR